MIPSVIITPDLAMLALSTGFAIPIGAKTRGALTRCCVVQTAGSLDGFSYALYAAAYACPPGASPTLPVDAACYNLVPSLTVTSGQSTYQGTWPADGVNHLWQPYSTGPDLRVGGLALSQQFYLLITANTAYAGKQFSCSLTITDANYT